MQMYYADVRELLRLLQPNNLYFIDIDRAPRYNANINISSAVFPWEYGEEDKDEGTVVWIGVSAKNTVFPRTKLA